MFSDDLAVGCRVNGLKEAELAGQSVVVTGLQAYRPDGRIEEQRHF